MVTPYVIFHKGPYYDDVTETYDNALEVTVYGDSKLIDSKYDYQNFEATMIAEISTNGIQRITGLSIAKRSLKLKDGSTISVSPNDNTSLIALFSQVLNKKNFRNNRITHDDARFLTRSNIKLSPSTNSIEDINSNLCISDDEN